MNTPKKPRVGDIVTFGRRHGERTRGEVVKVNRTRAKVRQIGGRGTYRDHHEGTVWTVPFSLIYDDTGAPLAPTRRESGAPPKRRRRRGPHPYNHGCTIPEFYGWR
jgi:hypothetical protein